MTRPKVYFPSMTTDEVLRYATQYAETELEKALAESLEVAIDDVAGMEKADQLSWELNDAGEDLVSAIKDILAEEDMLRIDGDVIDAVEKYESRVNAAYVENQKG